MKYYSGKVLYTEEKTNKNEKAYQLIYLLAGEEVVTITNWRNVKVSVYTDMDVRMLIQEKNNYKTLQLYLKYYRNTYLLFSNSIN